MNIGDPLERKKRILKKYYDVIEASRLFNMKPFEFPEFEFKSKEILGQDSKLCTNDMHFGEHAEYTLGYDDGTGFEEGFYIMFENNGYVQSLDSLKDVKRFLGLDESVNEYNFERGKNPKDAMGIGNSVNILGHYPNEEYKVFIESELTDMEKRAFFPNHRLNFVYKVKIAYGKNKNKIKYVSKFKPELFGKFWGMEIRSDIPILSKK
jgi:hypothetical protein